MLLERFPSEREVRRRRRPPTRGSRRPAPAPRGPSASRSSSRPSARRCEVSGPPPAGRPRPPPRSRASTSRRRSRRCSRASLSSSSTSRPRWTMPIRSRQQVDLAEDVAGHEDGHALALRQVAEQVADLDDSGRIQPVRRLVEDQQFGAVQQGAGEGQPLQVAERQRAGPSACVGAEREPVDHRIHAPAILDAAPAAGRRRGSRRPSVRGRPWPSRPGGRHGARGRWLPARPELRTARRARRSA